MSRVTNGGVAFVLTFSAASLAAIPGGSALWSAGLGEIPTANARARIELHGALRVPGCAPSSPPG